MTDGDLPDGWELTRLGDICVEERVGISSSAPGYSQAPYLGLEHIESNTGRILISEDEARHSPAKSNNFQFTADHVLYGKLRPYLNKVALPHFAGRCTTEIIPLRPTRADREWLAWFLRLDSTVEYAMKDKTGSRMPRASMKDLMKIEVALPPVEEQRRRVQRLNGHLTSINEARTAIDAQIAALEAMPAALLRKFFPRSRSARLSRGSRWVRLGEVCEVTMGQSPPSSDYRSAPTGLPFYQGSADFGVIHPTPRIWCIAPIRIARQGDILLSVRAPVGSMNIAKEDCCIGRGLAAIRGGSDVDQIYLRAALEAISRQLLRQSTGSTFQAITARQLRSTEFPLPLMSQQRRIGDHLATGRTAIEIAQRAARSRLESLHVLTSEMMNEAFLP